MRFTIDGIYYFAIYDLLFTIYLCHAGFYDLLFTIYLCHAGFVIVNSKIVNRKSLLVQLYQFIFLASDA